MDTFAAADEGRVIRVKPKRGFWLSALIIGAAILVWLMLAGTILTGVALVAAGGHDTGLVDVRPAVTNTPSLDERNRQACENVAPGAVDGCP